jgi:hypothetical protein
MALLVTITLLLVGIGTTAWVAIAPDLGLALVGDIVAISMCYFFAGWAFALYLLSRDKESVGNSIDS